MAHVVYHVGGNDGGKFKGKVTKQNYKALANHAFRSTRKEVNHSNENIDKSMTDYNIEFVGKAHALKYSSDEIDELIDDEIEKRYKGKRKLRKDAVVARQIICNPTAEAFDDCKTIEQKMERLIDFKDDVVEWFEDEFGERNILGGSGHFDETNPHLEFWVMPMTEDGRMSQKDFFKGPKHLKSQHKRLRKHMIDKGWDFEKENKYNSDDFVNHELSFVKENYTEIQKERQKAAELREQTKKEKKELNAVRREKANIEAEIPDLQQKIKKGKKEVDKNANLNARLKRDNDNLIKYNKSLEGMARWHDMQYEERNRMIEEEEEEELEFH